MISSEFPLASWFLVGCTTFFLLIIALPLLIAPLTWARWFGWKAPEGNTDLTVYFGRCLGAVALAIIITVTHGISDPKSHRALFDLVSLSTGLMVFVHVWGALRKAQPLSETVETAVWAMVFITSVWIRFSMLA
jgi:chromate transport protein ChrA